MAPTPVTCCMLKVLLVACVGMQRDLLWGSESLADPILWFLPHCNQTWHQLLSGEVVSFPVDNSQNSQGHQASGRREGFYLQTGHVLGCSGNWNV